MKNNKKIKIAILILILVSVLLTAVFLKPSYSIGTINYVDWGDISKIEKDYSYSTLFASKDTEIKVISEAGTKDSSGLFKRTKIAPGEELVVLITNCAINKNGELLDVVVKINNIVKFKNSKKTSTVSFGIGSDYVVPNSQKTPASNKTLSQKENEPMIFTFNTTTAQADFTMTYYKAGTYDSENDTGTYGETSSVSGMFWDIDILSGSETTYKDENFKGNEGIIPTSGNTTIYYNKNGKHSSKYSHTLQTGDNQGIAIKSKSTEAINDSIYYENSAFMTSSDLTNSTFSFTYSGSGCGIWFMFASPYPFEIDNPLKNATTSDIAPGQTFKYRVSQYIPNNYFGTLFSYNEIYSNLYKTSRFNNIVIKDTIDSHLIIDEKNIKVFNETNVDVTDYFEKLVDGNTVTATIKSTYFSKADFYAHTYTMEIPVTVKSDTKDLEKITNKATTTSSICRDDNDCPNEEKATNTLDVKMKYRLNVNYYENGKQGTKVATSDEEYKYYNADYNTNYNKVDQKVWQYVKSDGDTTSGKMTKDTTVNYYFEKRPYKLTVNYLEEGTNKPIDGMTADETTPLYYDSEYSTNYSKVNKDRWRIVRSEVKKGEGEVAEDKTISGQIKEDTEVNYYFEKIEYGLTVNYYEEGTKNAIAEPDETAPVYYNEAYKTNHDKIEHLMWRIVRSEVEKGEGKVVDEQNKIVEGTIKGDTVVNYYFEKIEYPVEVHYYDAETKEEIEESEKAIYYYGMKYYTNYDKIDSDIWEYVSQDGDGIEGEIDGSQGTYRINYYFNRLKYQLKVNYYDDKTKEKIEKSDRYAYKYEEAYETNYNKVDTEKWEYVRTEGETPGVIYEDTEIDYYFKNNEYTIEVNYYDEETGEKIEEAEILSKKYGEEYTTDDEKIDKNKWELVEIPENAEGIVEGDIEVNYYYHKKKYKLEVNYYEEGTKNKIAETSEREVYYGEKYITEYNKVEEKVWKLVEIPDNYQGEIKGDTIVNYYFKQVEIKNPPTGSNQNNGSKIIIPTIILIGIVVITTIMYRILLRKKIYKI